MNLKANLSKRQEQVAGFLATGYSKKEVAHHLAISERTVENTARSIYEKAEVRSVGQLCAWWFCKTFNISQQMLPSISQARVQAIACLLIALVTMNEVLNDNDKLKTRRCRVMKAVNIKSRRKTDDETV